MKVHLVRTKNYSAKDLQKVQNLLYPHPGYLSFSVLNKTFLYEQDNFEWQDFFGELSIYRKENQIPDNEFLVVLTKLKNAWNWFSAPNPAGTNEIFIDGSDWDNYIYADPAYPLAYEVVVNILQRFLFKTLEDLNSPLIHQNAIGCINDMCQWKPDITYKLRTADICSDCLTALEECVPDKTLITQCIEIIESLRCGMLFSKLWREVPEFETHLPFPVALTKRKLGMTQLAYTKLQLLIEHFDSLARTTAVIFSHLLLSEGEIAEIFETSGLNHHPSLGHWVVALKKISEKGQIRHQNFDLPQNINNVLSQLHKVYEANNIVNMRNDISHGYTELNDNIHITTFNEKISVVGELEQLLYPLFRRFNFFQIVSTDIKPANVFGFRVLDFSGSNSSFLEKEIEATFTDHDSLPQSKKMYLVSKDLKQWISLHPHWIFNVCPACKHPRLLVTDGVQYLDPFIGHRVNC